MSVKIRPLFELIPYVITILIQRIIFFENNRFLFQFNHQGGEIYNHLFPLISTGFLFAAANISAINTSVRSENAKKNSIIYRCVIFNILYLFLLGILLFLLSNKLQSFLDLKTINYNQFLEFILFSLSNFSGIVLFSCVEGFLILTKRTKILSVILIFMIFIHAAALRIFPVFFQFSPLKSVFLSTLVTYFFGLLLGMYIVTNKSINDAGISSEANFSLGNLAAEFKIAIIRSASPMLFMYFLLRAKSGSSLLVSYSMAGQISYFCALPFLAGFPFAVREQSQFRKTEAGSEIFSQYMKKVFFRYSTAPTIAAMLLVLIFPQFLFQFFFSYHLSPEQRILVQLFYLASIFGQIGHFLSIPIRSAAKAYLITRSFLVSELILQPLSLYFFFLNDSLDFRTVGISILIFTLSYLLINAFSLRFIYSGIRK